MNFRARFSTPAPLLLLLLLAACAGTPSRPAAPAPLLLVSVDGLRADVVGSGRMPALDAIARDGVRARWMNPSYPTLTFPNHYTLVTGLRPDRHGIVHNTMRDAALGRFSLGNRAAVGDARWWGGEPAWVTLQKRGGRAATMFWPGSEAPVAGQYPADWRPFDAAVTPAQRVDQVLAWLDRPAATRPGFLTLYFDQVDHGGHDAGPESAEATAAMAQVDAALARLLDGLRQRGLRDRVNLLVVSDHGMAPAGSQAFLDDLLAAHGLAVDAVDVVTDGQVAGLAPRPGFEAVVASALVGPHAHAECWRREDLPTQWHYGSHPRVPPIVCQADTGWRLSLRAHPQASGGSHGYRPEDPAMRAVFVAHGPAFRDGAVLAPFDNVDVYPLLMRLLGLEPLPNDGDGATWTPVLREPPPGD